MSLLSAAGLTQDYPSKPIRLVVPYAAGNTGDISFRIIAPMLEARLGQRFVLDNKAGASGNIGAAEVARAAPDGYTLLLGATNNFVTNQYLYKGIGFDPLEAFVPITLISDGPTVVIANPALPAKSLRELAAYAKSNPGELNFGSPGAGTPPHLAAALFMQLAGADLVHVPYKGSPPAVQALLANEIQLYFTALSSVAGHIKSGKLIALAVAAPNRLEALPNVPTTAEAGFPDLLTGNWWALAAPRGTDPKTIERLAADVKAALVEPAVRERFGELGLVAGGQSPAELAAQLRSEAERWKKVIESARIAIE